MPGGHRYGCDKIIDKLKNNILTNIIDNIQCGTGCIINDCQVLIILPLLHTLFCNANKTFPW